MSRSFHVILVSALFTVTLASQTQAASHCVNPTGSGNCFAAIQDAVDAAVAGDKISIKNGVYFENVTVPAGMEGLRISGSKNAILDPGEDMDAATVDNTGDGFLVESNDVTIQGFTIRNGESGANSIALADGVTGTTIDRMRFVNCGDDCIQSEGLGNHDTLVKNCSFFGSSNDGTIDLVGDMIELNRNHVLGGDNDPVQVDGDDMIVERNTILLNGNDTDCTRFVGDRAEIVRNVIEGCSNDAIELTGNDALISRNRIENADAGIVVTGDNPVITNNHMHHIFDDEGIDVNCSGACDQGMVSRNRMFQGPDDADGMEIDATDGFTVERNIAEQFTDKAYDLNLTNGIVSRNRAIDSSAIEGDPCFEISGDGSMYDRNSADGCSDGFRVLSNDNTFDRNTATGGAEDGFEVDNSADGNTFTNNRATNNAGVGFELDDGTTNTTLTNNQASGNHTDLCDDAAGTVLTDNKFDTTYANNTPDDGDDECPILD